MVIVGTGTKGSVDLQDSYIAAAIAAASDHHFGFAPPDSGIWSVVVAQPAGLAVWCSRQR